MKSEDQKALIRCPGGCGLPIDFTALTKCCRCGKLLCSLCKHRYKDKVFCKKCHREYSAEISKAPGTTKTGRR